MAFDREAALANGYTEQEIDAFLNQSQASAPPAPAQAAPDRTAEYMGTTAAGAAAAVPIAAAAAGGYGAYRGIRAALPMVQNMLSSAPAAPVAPVMPSMQPPTVSPTYVAPTAQPASPSIMQQGQQMAARMREIASSRVQPLMRGGIGIGAALTPGTLNSNEQQELARRRGMPPQITP
jgi:hypothetical protein